VVFVAASEGDDASAALAGVVGAGEYRAEGGSPGGGGGVGGGGGGGGVGGVRIAASLEAKPQISSQGDVQYTQPTQVRCEV
jgi:hypothetical protein